MKLGYYTPNMHICPRTYTSEQTHCAPFETLFLDRKYKQDLGFETNLDCRAFSVENYNVFSTSDLRWGRVRMTAVGRITCRSTWHQHTAWWACERNTSWCRGTSPPYSLHRQETGEKISRCERTRLGVPASATHFGVRRLQVPRGSL